ncbi:MAG: peptidoglycan editing factor PgeF [Gammaproteobacteria bacterium]|nr:peptidoglycan editing factor PgeF [Gammaproteobacteria bacterium]
MSSRFITPDWPAPGNIKAMMTTRDGGVSAPPFDSLNLGDHVGDLPEAVAQNRKIIKELLELPAQPKWLNQTHSTIAIGPTDSECDGDACFTDIAGTVCAVMTADCLPLLVCHRDGTEIAAIHAGWRGLSAGVIETTISQMRSKPDELMVWLGVAIGPDHFEVGDEVRQQFLADDAQADEAFRPSKREGHWIADIYRLARFRLKRLGVCAIYGGGLCSYSDSERFFSYRRDGVCGRMASLIWME